jgi:carboxyl-terminal processing protease
VLVNSDSASASELFARTMQLQHRATVIGDLSAGAVMESRIYPFQIGVTGGNDLLVFYSASITHDDLFMTDGKSLEKVGVTPDVEIVPTGADLAAGRDPVLAQAAQLAGAKLDPAAAGKFFPFEWAPLQQ